LPQSGKQVFSAFPRSIRIHIIHIYIIIGRYSIMNKLLKKIVTLTGVVVLLLALAAPAYAAAPEAAQAADNTIAFKAIASGVAIGIAAAAGAVSMAWATTKAAESIARQPEAEGKIRTALMLGLVFIETAIIYALLAVILIIFVL